MSLLAIFQWLVGSLVYYSDLNPGMTFQITIMQVNYNTYFQYAFPGTLAFVLGLNLLKLKSDFFGNLKSSILNNIGEHINRAKVFIVIGFLVEIFSSGVPIFLRSYFDYLTYLKYVGLGILVLNYIKYKDKKALIYILIALPLIILSVLKSLMFGDLVFSFALLFIVIVPFLKVSLIKRFTIVFLLGTLVIGIQLIKGPARAYMRKNENASVQVLVQHLRASDVISKENLLSEGFLSYSIARFNQGAVVSWVMNRVPKKIPYENGNTIASALVGSFIPRIVWPSKPIMGAEMYKKYTGLPALGASFGISQLGEAYVNFGVKGGIVCMFILGLIFNLILNLSLKKSNVNHVFYWLIPLIFLHGLSAETDLTRTYGFMIRFLIVMAVFNWILKKFFSRSIY